MFIGVLPPDNWRKGTDQKNQCKLKSKKIKNIYLLIDIKMLHSLYKSLTGQSWFQLKNKEVELLISQNAMSRTRHGGRRTLPYAFSEHGAVMAANILNIPIAVQMSVIVVRAFVNGKRDAVSFFNL